MNKRGQFYLVAAIIVVIVILGIVGIRNFAKSPATEPIVYDIKKELNFETGKVVDYAKFNDMTVNDYIQDWTTLYVESKNYADIENWIFLYINGSDISAIQFDTDAIGDISLYIGGTQSDIPMREFSIKRIDNDDVKLEMNGLNYTVDTSNEQMLILIKKGENVA